MPKTSHAPLSPVDISSSGFADDPIQGHALIRATGPIVWQRDSGGYLLSGHALTAHALRDRNLATFDISAGWRSIARKSGRDFGPAMDMFAYMPLNFDGPRHAWVRRAMAIAIAPVGGGHPSFQAQIDRRVRAARAAGGFDLAADFALHLLFDIMADLMMIAPDDRDHVRPMSTLSWVFEGTPSVRQREAGSGQVGTALAFLRKHVRQRIADADQGFIGMAYGALPAEEDDKVGAVAAMICVLLAMGNQPLATSIVGGVDRLMSQDDRIPPADWHTVADDAIRYVAPVDFLHRVATTDVTIAGCPVRKGQRLILSPLSANHDPAEYGATAGSILPRPKMDAGLSFGAGAHLCVGHRMARTINKAALVALGSLPKFRSTGAIVKGAGNVIRTYVSMPLELL